MDCNEISCLTLKTKEIALDVENSQLWIDFAKILKCRDDVYINITPVIKKFKGEKAKVENYLRLAQTKAYQKVLERIFLIDSDVSQLKIKENMTPSLKHGLIYRRKGRYGGTWLHKEMFLDFARWLSPHFAVMCDQIIMQVIMQADELKEGRDVLRKLQRPLNDVIKAKLVDTGIKNDTAYMQFAVMIKKLIGCPDDRDAYTKNQLDTAKMIIEEYRAMIVHGGMKSLKEMNEYLHTTPLNLAWKLEE